jgi:hypothetical protein
MDEFVAVGGINHPEGRIGLSGPLVQLEATPKRLQFTPRFGLRRFLGPWVIERDAIGKIRPTSTSLAFFTGIEVIEGKRVWIFWSFRPEAVLAGLRDLGYPVQATYD